MSEQNQEQTNARLAVARRLKIYQKSSSAIFIALLVLLILVILIALIFLGQTNSASLQIWVIGVMFAIVIFAGVVAKVWWPQWMFGQAFREVRERGGLVCPFDGAQMSPMRIGEFPHRLVHCMHCGRIAGETNIREFWSDYKKLEDLPADDLLIGSDADMSWWKPRYFMCPFDGGTLIPVGDEPPELCLGYCDRCYWIIPLRLAVKHRVLQIDDCDGAATAFKRQLGRVVIPPPEPT